MRGCSHDHRRGGACLTALLLASALGCASEPQQTAAGEPEARAGTWPAGARYRYAIDLSSESQLGKAPEVSWGYGLKAELELAPLVQTGGAVDLVATIHRPTVTPLGAQAAQGSASTLEAALSRPFVVQVNGGRVAELRVEDGASAEAVALLRTLAAALQVPAKLGEAPVVTAEHDATGRYEARYRLVGREVEKTKLRYLRVLSVGAPLGREATPSVAQSKVTLRTAADGVIVSVQSQETLRSTLPGDAEVSARTQLQLRLLRREPASALADAPAGLIALPSDRTYGRVHDREYFDAVRTEGMSLAQAMDAATRTASNAEDASGEASLRAFSALAALIREDPSHVAEVVQRARKRPEQAGQMFDALASAGSDPAQAALVALIEDPKASPKVREAAVWSLVRVKLPTAAQVSLLERLVDDPQLSEYAIFGLGIASRRLRVAGGTERASAIAVRLQQLLEAAQDEARRVRVLRGIANAAASELVNAVAPMLLQPSRDVREAAVAALKEMDVPTADELLVERLHADKESSVRKAAVQALDRRTPSGALGDALARAALADTDAHVRYQATATLARWLEARPELRSTLERIASRDPEPKLREQAARALGQSERHEDG